MKKIVYVLALLLCCTSLFGCGNKTTAKDEELKIISLSGEDTYFSISNAILVLNGENDIFYGGNLKINDNEAFKDIVSYDVTFNATVNGEDRVLMSNAIIDKTGNTLSLQNDTGKISGDFLNLSNIERVWCEVKTKDLDEKENSFSLDLELKEITSNESN